MKDTKLIIGFIVVGLIVAYFVGAPLRRPASSEPRVGTPLQDDAKVYAEGTINADPSLGQAIQNYPALFLFVKAPGTQMPIAVRRIPSPTFPLAFRLTEHENMAGEGFYDGDITVTARLDQDGGAGPKQSGDFEASAPLTKGADRHITLTIK